MTLGAMSEDAWKEVRLPLGLKEKLGSLNTAEKTAFLRTPGPLQWNQSVSMYNMYSRVLTIIHYQSIQSRSVDPLSCHLSFCITWISMFPCNML